MTSRMARCASLNFCTSAILRFQWNNQALRAVGRRAAVFLRPRHMVRTGSVTGLARDIDFRPRRGIAVIRQIIVSTQIGRVTIGTDVVPCLVAAGPMQRIAVRHLLVGIEMEPLLAALLFSSRISGETQTLKPDVRKRQEILLTRKDTKCVCDGIICKLTVRPIRPNVELTVSLIKTGDDMILCESRIAKICENG